MAAVTDYLKNVFRLIESIRNITNKLVLNILMFDKALQSFLKKCTNMNRRNINIENSLFI